MCISYPIITIIYLDRINPSADDPRDTTIFHSVHEEEQSRGVELQHQDNVNSMITIEHNPIEQKTNQVNSIVDTDVGSSSSSITDASRQISISDEQTSSSDTMSIVSSSSSSLPATVAVQALATTNVPSKIDITITSDNSKPNFEEVCIFGMTVSPEGFCVLLQGLICDRILKVLVTPQDPMSDGLDRNEVETSEAVTLLQLLQGIDVETYLAHDALSTHFGGDNKHKYSLRQVTIKEVDPKKKFSGSLMGKKRQLSDVSDDATTPISTSGISILSSSSSSSSHRPTVLIQENNRNSNNRDDVNNNNNNNNNNNIQQDLLSSSSGVPDSSSAPIVLSASSSGLSSSSTAVTYGLSGSNNGNGSSSSSSSSSQSLTEVKVDSAYFAIALALRHNTAIVVRSDLLHDEELSYTTDEIRSYYPKMVETTTCFIPKIDSRGTEYVRGLMIKRYYEAIRQRNEEKIRQFESYVNYNVSVDGSSRSSSSVGVNYIVGQDSNVTNASI